MVWAKTLTGALLAQHRRAALILLGLTLAVWTIALLRNASPVAGGADSSGYLNNTRLLLQGRIQGQIRTLPAIPETALPPGALAPLGFRTDPATRTLEPTYPFGFPLLLAPFHSLLGDRQGTLAALILLGLAAPLLTYHLARQTGLPTEWASFAAVGLTASALFQMQAYQPMTDVQTLVVATAVLILLRRFDLGPWNGILLGALLALGVLSRPANILLFLPVGFFLLQSPRRLLRSWTIVLGGLPGAIAQMAINRHLYDRFLTTGYGDFSSFFNADNALPALGFFFRHGLVLATPMAVLGFLAFAWIVRRDPARLLAPVVLALSFILFYAFYFFASEYWWSLRFILPTFPVILIVGSHLWFHLGNQVAHASSPRNEGTSPTPPPRFLKWVPFLFSLIAIVIGLQTGRKHAVHDFHLSEADYPRAAAWLGAHTSANDVIVCMQTSGSVFHELPNPILRWDYLKPQPWLQEVAPSLLQDRRVLAALFPFEQEKGALQTHLPGNWKHLTDIGRVAIYELEP